MKILVFDNYDSFTYNLVHLVKKISTAVVDVVKNDAIALEQVKDYDKIILSPGPGIPSEAGLLKPLVKEYAATKSILGVCLGHQAIGEVFGGTLVNLTQVYHGLATPVRLTDVPSPLFKQMPQQFTVGRYHSWVVNKEDFPDALEITAEDDKGLVMALQHKNYDVQGVQFHPESVLTPDGEVMIKNWLDQ